MKKKSIALLLLVMLLFTACGSSGSGDVPASGGSADPVSDGELEPGEEELTEKEPEEEPADTALAAGETVELGDWEITLDSYEFTDSIPLSFGSYNAEEGSRYLVANMTVKNNGKESASFLPPIYYTNKDVVIRVFYKGDYEFQSSTLLGHSDDLHTSSLNPLTSKSGMLAFQIPIEAIDDVDSPLVLRVSLAKESHDYSLR